MDDELTKYHIGGAAVIAGLVVLALIGWLGYSAIPKGYDKPWFEGSQTVQACVSLTGSCVAARAFSVEGQITNLYVGANTSESGFFQSACSKDDIVRFCTGELRSGGRLYIRE